MKTIFYIFLFIQSSLIAQNTSSFEAANDLYNNGDYQEAINKYESIIATDQHSAELYYNLGNAHYKLNNVAPSIYYYEKALQLKPNDKEVLNNIAYAKNMTIDAIQDVPKLGLSRFYNSLINILTFDTWAKLSVGFMIAFIILFLVYYFGLRTTLKRLSFVSGFVFLVLSIISLALAFQKQALDNKNNPAIVFSQESEVKTAPNLGAEDAFVLHEGTKVMVLDAVNNWKKIKISDGKTGWIISADIKLLNDF